MANKDEPKGTPKDESKGKGTPKDESKGTPKDKGKLFTTAEIDKIKSDSASMGQGRAETIAKQKTDALEEELTSVKSRQDVFEREQNENRLAEARGDPVKLQSYQRDQAAGKESRRVEDLLRDITRREGLLKTAQEAVDADKGVVSVAYIAAKHGLEVERLEKLGITDPEILEKVAEEMKPAEAKGDEGDKGGEGDKGDKGDKDDESLKLDSGEGGGGGDKTYQEKLNERYPTMKTN